MSNLSLSWVNRLDGALFSATSEASNLQALNLANADRWRLWRSSGSVSATLDIDFGAAYSIGVLALFGLTLGATDTIRHRLSAVSAGAGELLDTTALASGIATGYGQHVTIVSPAVSPRYWRVDIAAASLATTGFFQCRRGWAGPLVTLERTYDWGFEETPEDGSAIERLPMTGAEFVDPGAQGRVLSLQLNTMTAGDRANLRELRRICGVGLRQLLVVPNAAGDLARDPILGRIAQASALSHRALNVHAVPLIVRETSYTEIPTNV